ncbi:MAG: hypothetical protein M1837_004951 [Sclerophora amabilis]|nr:MAG: hypothetical protein M1837_004951 [Sclerophora amabilis]
MSSTGPVATATNGDLGYSNRGQHVNGAQSAQAAGTHPALDEKFSSPGNNNNTMEPLNGMTQTFEHVTQGANGVGAGPGAIGTTNHLQVLCGPLLNYKRMSDAPSGGSTWHGSVLIVAKPGQLQPELQLSCGGPVAGVSNANAKTNTNANVNGVNGVNGGPQGRNNTDSNGYGHEGVNGVGQNHLNGGPPSRSFPGVKLYADPAKTFWRFEIDLPLQQFESRWQYTIPSMQFSDSAKNGTDHTKSFYVPSEKDSMRMMFHSCNGFSVGTDEEFWSGTALWHDVLRTHERKPFHVMIGGGDQIYNDGVRAKGPLKPWTDIASPRKRRDFPFSEELRAQCDEYYFENYAQWYGAEPFASANASIPQINIWDDHDIIDGFGSYTDHFMQSHVFRGIGGIAHKYYMLFQHHFPPPVSTFTSEAPQTTKSQGTGGTGADPGQLGDTFVMQEKHEDPSWIIGSKPGPYVAERSRSLYMQLGHKVAFVGLDARTERTRHQINYPETYDLVFQRLNTELAHKAGQIKHLVVLLGVPIAYPRLIWLENILTSPIIGPIRFLNKRFGVAGGLFNSFDGQVDLLDDLDDHYTARQHKKERKELMHRLQNLAAQYSVRVTILGGDVHLAAVGRFYSNPKLHLPTEHDHRYMANIVSSAITNKPPPKAVANMLASRNKIHRLDHDTDETLMDLFDKPPGGVPKAANKNHSTMPSRNYAILTETGGVASTNGQAVNVETQNGASAVNGSSLAAKKATGKNGHSFLNTAEEGAGSSHAAAEGFEPSDRGGPHGLDVCIKVEINNSDKQGHTMGYGLSSQFTTPSRLSVLNWLTVSHQLVPALDMTKTPSHA